MSKTKDSNLQKEIRSYLMDQNRPFSANDILNNMHGDYGKTAFTKALDLLVIENTVKEKIYGKQKVFFINQDIFKISNNDDLLAVDAQIDVLSNTFNSLQKQIKNLECTLGDLRSRPTTDAAKTELQSIKDEIAVLRDELKKLESNCTSFDPNEKKSMFTKKEKVVKEYQRRKRLANNIIDAILEGYPKSKKELLEDLGVEVDGDINL